MRNRVVLPVVILAGLALAACGSGSAKSASKTTTTVVQLSSPSWETAKPYPSKSAKMVCQTEVRTEIRSALGITETSVKPSWNKAKHLFSCVYTYPTGKIVLSVKELSNEQQTTASIDAVKKKYGAANSVLGIGQGAFLLKNDGLVARKDYKVLLVDVHGVPKDFVPRLSRSSVAQSIATTIMGCWTGA